MDSAEKVIVFNSFEDLKQEIIRDRDTRDMLAQRYAVRFIMLNNFNEFKKLAKFMAASGVRIIIGRPSFCSLTIMTRTESCLTAVTTRIH